MGLSEQSMLLVDANPKWARQLEFVFERSGVRVDLAENLSEAQAKLEESSTGFVVLGVEDPNRINTPQLRTLTSSAPQARFIALLGEPNESLEELLRQLGVSDFFSRNLPHRQLVQILSHYLEMRALEEQVYEFQRLMECRTSFESLVGGSAPMRALYRLVEQVSRAESPVLVLGEPGSEFDEVARSLHQRSDRGLHPIVTVDCAAAKPDAAELEIFGPVAADGPYAAGPSLEDSAYGRAGSGTLVLHGIESLAKQTQQRLLDFLRHPFFQGETSATAQPVARLVATSTQELQSLVERGAFNRELYYRMSILRMRIPPLRKRREDIPLLSERCLQRINANRGGKNQPASLSFSAEAFVQLFRYNWPGNVAQLEAAVAEAARRTKTLEIRPQDLPDALRAPDAPSADAASKDGAMAIECVPLRDAKRQFETKYFQMLLTHTQGNMTMASRISRVGRPYLYKKLKEYDIDPDKFR